MNAARPTIFLAKRIITMNAAQPEATAVAVRDGRILGVGSRENLAGWGEHEVDGTFAGKVLMPGLVEAHSHVTEAGSWSFTWVGPYDRRSPDGKVHSACRSVDEVLERLTEAERVLEGDGPLIAWGFDPLSLSDGDLDRRHLDRVSASRVVVVATRPAQAERELCRAGCGRRYARHCDRGCGEAGRRRTQGTRGDAGDASRGQATVVCRRGVVVRGAIRDFGRLARNTGCTTISDLGTK
jgi:predicted amidohydrolase YtcJ